MKKLLVLVPFFAFAACGGIDINIGEDANAQTDCSGGSGGGAGDGGSNSAPCDCECKAESFDGVRLKKQYIIGDDGSRVESGEWLDTQTGLVCSFQDTDIGTFCLPKHTAMNTFLDPDCQVPIYVNYGVRPACDLPTFVRMDSRDILDKNSCGYGKTTGFSIYAANTSEPKQISKWYTFKSGFGNSGTEIYCASVSDDPNKELTHVAYGVHLVGKYTEFVSGKRPQGL